MKPTDQTRLSALADALKVAQGHLNLEQVVALLTIACTPGLSVNELAEEIRAPQQSASRYVSVLMGRYIEPHAEGDIRPFITQEVKQDDPRSRALFLADRGREVVQSFLDGTPSKKDVPHDGR